MRGPLAGRHWLFLAPLLLTLALVAGWPLARTIWFSFTDARLDAATAPVFVGLANYLEYYQGGWYGVLADPLWWRSVGHTLYFAALSVTLEVVLGLGVALVLNQHFPGRGLVRAAVLVPWAIPTVVSAKLWSWLLHDQFGAVNALLLTVGLIGQPIAWLADPLLALHVVIVVDVWKTTPFAALLLLAALQLIPRDYYDAAQVDGAGPVARFFHITLPLLRPALLVVIVFRLLDALRVFDLVYVLTANSEATSTMSVYARQQLVDFQDLGYGSAASTLLFAVAAVCTALALWLLRPRQD